jgi:formylmethanofuran dehydrogenase subunit E
VLGVRIGLAGGSALRFVLPDSTRNLLLLAETDGCFVDGLEAATGCSIGHRTMRLEDSGRVAATFVDVTNGRAVRVAPASGIRQKAGAYVPGEPRRYYAQLEGYQRMPDAELLSIDEVLLVVDLKTLLGRRGVRVDCSSCGEEILNDRGVTVAGQIVCPGCCGRGYYTSRPGASVQGEVAAAFR